MNGREEERRRGSWWLLTHGWGRCTTILVLGEPKGATGGLWDENRNPRTYFDS